MEEYNLFSTIWMV